MDGFQISYWLICSVLWAILACFVLFSLLLFLYNFLRLSPLSSSAVPNSATRATAVPAPEEDSDMDAAAKEMCVICLGGFKGGETLRCMPKCGHVFHADCVDVWVRCHATCPCCRADLAPVKPGDSDLSKVLPDGLSTLV